MARHVLLLLACLTLPAVLAFPTCEECTEAFTKLVTRMLSEKSLAEQVEILKAEACATQADPAACNDLVDTWWTIMASILYPSLIVPADFCVYLGNCQQRDWRLRSGDWTCQDCTNGLEFAAGYLADEQAEAAAPDCADQMASWLPVALPVLAGALDAQKV